MRKALIFPGYPYSCEEGKYPEVLQIYRDEGFEVETAGIRWSKNLEVNLDRAAQIIEEYSHSLDKDDELHLFGHSWGAVCALWASRNQDIESQILASLSPEFEEDFQQYPKWGRKFGYVMRKFMSLFGRPGNLESPPSLKDLEEKNLGELRLLYGHKEYHGYYGIKYLGFGHYVSENRLNSLPNSSEIIVEGSGHMLNDSYVEAIEEQVQTIS